MNGPHREILVVDLLGGIGDMIMLLPAVHALGRRNPAAALRVLTHEPGAQLIRADPAVTEVRTPRSDRPGAERAAVREALAAHHPDLAVTTTRYDGIPDLLIASGARCVTDLWRAPPPDEPVGHRYLRILHAEGLLDATDLAATPRVPLHPAELAAGSRMVAARLPAAPAGPPAVLVTDAGMAVKRWPARYWHRLAELLAVRGHPLLRMGVHVSADGPSVDADPPAVRGPVDWPVPVAALPPGDLRQLAAAFAAIAALGGVVIGADTGPVRLAAAVGARTVALFGPTLAARYGVAADELAGADLQGLADCPHRRPTAITEQPCWWTANCPLSNAGPACMADLRPTSVARTVVRLSG